MKSQQVKAFIQLALEIGLLKIQFRAEINFRHSTCIRIFIQGSSGSPSVSNDALVGSSNIEGLLTKPPIINVT